MEEKTIKIGQKGVILQEKNKKHKISGQKCCHF